MKIDVILPTYNRRAFLPRAIACLRAQTFRDWRLLIVNDGGEDVADIVAGFNDARLVYFNRPHAGKAAQLNFALGEVTAPYVSYMDDDDDVFPNHLERLLFAAESLGADFVYSDTYLTILDPNGKVVRRTIENTRDAPYDEIRLYNRINHKQVLHTRELVERIGGYDAEMRILIDFDGIKRLVGAAKRPFHLREITGEHFLRMDAKTGAVSSISGLWKKDPAAAGRSLLRFFEKDPEALARLYRSVPMMEEEVAHLKARAAKRWSARLKAFFRRTRKPSPGVFTDALPPAGNWRDATPAKGLLDFFCLADETHPALAAVNRIATGARDDATRRAAYDGTALPYAVAEPRFTVTPVSDGLRFTSSGTGPMRWVMLTGKSPLPRDFALEFDYVPHTVFREQLQFDWAMSTLGDRLRFMVRDNERLVANAVEKNAFPPDGRTLPFAFTLGASHRVRIESHGGVHSFIVDGRNLLSLTYDGNAGATGNYAALVFYEATPDRPIDFEIRNFRFSAPVLR